MKKFKFVLMMLVLILSTSFSAYAVAPDVINGETIDIQLFEQSVHLNMPKNTSSYWFIIPEGSVVGNDCYLNLNMSLSSTLIGERSSISLVVNGTTLETKWIYDIAKNYTCWWKVPVPSSLLKVGKLNELTITTTQRSIEGDCADIDNPSNWVRFDTDSYFHMVIEQHEELYLGNLYSVFYDNFNDKHSMQNEYVLPKNADISAVQCMLKVASAVGANGKDKDLLRSKVSMGAPSDASLKNKLYIGNIDKWINSSVLQLPRILNASEGFLSVKNNEVLITGSDEIGLDKAVSFFSDRTYLDEILEKQLIVTSDVKNNDTNSMAPNETGFYRFEDFGYDTINLKGAFHQSTVFSFRQPGGIKSEETSYVNVKFHHSKALLSDNSLLSIYFNNVACDSVKLSASNAGGGNLKVKIPKDVRNEETIELRIEVYNYLGKVDCSKDFSDTAWTVIDKESEIYFEPNDEGVCLTLTRFPYFSTLYKNNNAVTMCMPANHDIESLNIISILSTRIGQMSGTAFNYSLCASAAEITKDDKKNNMVFVGSFDDIWLPEEVSTGLGVVPSMGSFKIKGNLGLSSETLRGKIIFQVIRSPWHFDKKIYVFTYDKSIEAYVAKFLSDKKLLNQLDEQVSVADMRGRVTNYTFGNQYAEKDNEVPLTLERIKYIIEKKTGVPLWFISTLSLLILIAIFVLIKVIRNKNRFKKAAENMRHTNIEMDTHYSDEEDSKSHDK